MAGGMSEAVQRLEMGDLWIERGADGSIVFIEPADYDTGRGGIIALTAEQVASLQWFLNQPMPKTKEA
jgi:hypothetical protein